MSSKHLRVSPSMSSSSSPMMVSSLRDSMSDNKQQRWSMLTSALLVKIFGYVDDVTRLIVIERTCKAWNHVMISSGWTSLDVTDISDDMDAAWCHAMGNTRLKTVQTLKFPEIRVTAFERVVRSTPRAQHVRGAIAMMSTLNRVAKSVLSVLSMWTQLRSLKLGLQVYVTSVDDKCIVIPALPFLQELSIQLDLRYTDGGGYYSASDGEGIFKVVLSPCPELTTLDVNTEDPLMTLVSAPTSWDPNGTLRNISIRHNLRLHKKSITWNHLVGRSVKHLLHFKTDDVTQDDIKLISEMCDLQSLIINPYLNVNNSTTFFSPLSTLSKLATLRIPLRNSENTFINPDFMSSLSNLQTICIDNTSIVTLKFILTLISRFTTIQNIQINRTEFGKLNSSLHIDQFRQFVETIKLPSNPAVLNADMLYYNDGQWLCHY